MRFLDLCAIFHSLCNSECSMDVSSFEIYAFYMYINRISYILFIFNSLIVFLCLSLRTSGITVNLISFFKVSLT